MKHLVTFMLSIMLACACLPAQAARFALQDPVTFSYYTAEHLFNYNKETHLQKQYKVSRSKMPAFIQAYVSMLLSDNTLEYLGMTQNGRHIYHCFAPAKGYQYATFQVVSYGKPITPVCCIAVQYEENDTKAYIRYGLDFCIQDNGLRMGQFVQGNFSYPDGLCITCDGFRQLSCPQCLGAGVVYSAVSASVRGGAPAKNPCPSCDGAGVVPCSSCCN